MNEETPEQKLWKLEREVLDLKASINCLIRIVEGTDTNSGIKDVIRDIKSEVARISRIAQQLESLEEIAVRKEELRLMDDRLKTVEKRETIREGVGIGQRAIWIIVSSAVAFVALVLGLLLRVSSLIGQVVP